MFSTIARATAASAAAIIIIKIANICPSIEKIPYREKAIKFRLAAFRMSSMPNKTPIAFLRDITANNPNENNRADSTKK